MAAAAILVAWPAWSADPREAEESVRRKDFRGALAMFRDLTGAEPAELRNWIWRARLEAWTREFALAEATYDHIHREWPGNVEALTGRVYLEIWRERYREAEQFLQRAEAAAPLDPGVLAVRVRLHRAQANAGLARIAFAALERAHPSHPETAEVRKELREMPSRWELTTGIHADRLVATNTGRSAAVSVRHTSGRNSVTASLSEGSRGIESPSTFSLGFTRRQGRDYWLSASASVSNGAKATPGSEYRAEISRRAGAGRAVGFAYSQAGYAATTVHAIAPSFETALPRGLSAWGGYSRAWIQRESGSVDSKGWFARLTANAGRRVTISGGGAASSAIATLAAEGQLGAGRDRSVFGELRVRLNPTTRVGFSCTRRVGGANPRWLSAGLQVTRSF